MPLKPRAPLIAAVSLLFLAGGCFGTAERTVREVVIYTSVDQVYAEPILKAFERQSGIRVKAVYDVEATKTVGLANRLIAEKSSPKADVFWNGEFVQTIRLKREDVLAPYSSPSAKDFPGDLIDKDAYWTGLAPRYRVWISALSFKPRPIAFEEFSQVDLPGNQMAMSLPLFGTGSFQAAAMAALHGEEEAATIYEGYLKKGIRTAPGNSTVRDWVVSGQVVLGLTDSDDACGAIRRGAKVRVFLPAKTLLIPGTLGLIKGGPNTAEGKALIDYLLGPETEKALIESGFSEVALHPGSPKPCLGLPNPACLDVDVEKIAGSIDASAARMKVIFAK